ncbi:MULTISPECIES: Na+/H+ antiporter NhaA [unclassified Streptomyces]|uniref:Na+/H+ antiporter NhaA n=1 Tax=unclassified Streptomyces TaxID=2593676 RepID=UPI002254A121|nr:MULTISPECIES: Na+/H+ antiporter NhaA [unclassified Streptomyces]WSP56104.1 Na+/H+ antiporter NhaA [Streptomyces sp. NBC_01241]WSU23198.1 Na+/H+ antiporter NhaA [Streptomyces sp. NBC_01108]MCX4787802.1 Na+/H+ antiporter NhaA [Streptomyces sp. NBC_01221]MCX4796435.1 Na+/H+ antiporter NhaA [Streptomyces sp. NBC_01242]WSP64067.1 Na+/H+ antiporter NhaA [Streptomyces sp. NBC_01240]
MPDTPRERFPLLGLLPWDERPAVSETLRTGTAGGPVLPAVAVVALIRANSAGRGAYESVGDAHAGVSSLALGLSVGHRASDGLLTVCFLVAGIELKREPAVGELRTPATAALPLVAEVCGMAVPALSYASVSAVGGGSPSGWAIPMATGMAFTPAVLAVLGTSLPWAPRAFLPAFAVADALGPILITALFFIADGIPDICRREQRVPVVATGANHRVRTVLHSMGLDRSLSYPDDKPRHEEHR